VRRNRRKPLLAAGEDIAVALLRVLVFLLGELLAGAFGHHRTHLLQQPFHVDRPAIAVGLDHKGEIAQQVRAAQAVVAVRVGEIDRQAVVDDDTPVARDDVDGIGALAPALAVAELQGDLAAAVDVDPVVFAIDPQGGLIGVPAGLGEQQLEQHHQGLEQGLAILSHLASGAQLRELPLEAVEFLAQVSVSTINDVVMFRLFDGTCSDRSSKRSTCG
jgi:hypothetical protein